VVEQPLRARAKQSAAPALTVRRIDDLDAFNAIEADWNRLVERSDADPIFLSHTWLRTWWECFGRGRRLHVITVWADDRLIGAAPLMATAGRFYGLSLRLLESIYNYHTPRFDFPVAERRDEVYSAVWRELSREDGPWDAVVLAQAPEESPLVFEMKRRAVCDGWLAGQWTPSPSPVIRLDCDYASFLKRLTSKERYNLRRRLSRLQQLGPVQLEEVRDRQRVREAMKDGLRIEAAAWKGENGTAINSDADVEEFYTRLAERAADAGLLRLYFLRSGDKRIAFNYSFVDRSKIYAVKIGYDPDYHTYSPGHLLLLEIIERACSQGIQEYDFLGGDDEWKYMWTSDVHRHEWLFLFRNRLRPRLIYRAKFHLAPRLKRFMRK